MATMPAHSPEDAARYDRTAEPLMVPLAVVLADAAQVRTEAAVLDLVCGPGFAARVAAERAGPMGTVVGVDPDAAMLQVAAGHGAGYAIEWLQAEPENLPLPSDSQDVVLSLHGMTALAQPRAAMAEALRVVRQTGSFAATVWSPIEANPYLAAYQRALTEQGATEAVEVLRAATGCGAEQLTGELRAAGWHEPARREVTLRIRLAGTIAAATERLRGMPWGARLSTDAALAAARSTLTQLTEFAEADGSLVVPFRAQLVHAYP